jgi:hypothetical protein
VNAPKRVTTNDPALAQDAIGRVPKKNPMEQKKRRMVPTTLNALPSAARASLHCGLGDWRPDATYRES